MPLPKMNGNGLKKVRPVWVSRMHDGQHGDAFVLVGADNQPEAMSHIERLVARDFPRFRGSPWTAPAVVGGLYQVGPVSGPLFAAMPKEAPIILGGE